MQIIDIIILALVLLGVVMGFRSGFIKQLAALIGLVVGLVAAKMLYVTVGDKLAYLVANNALFAHIAAFVMIWLLVPVIFSIVAELLTKLLEFIYLGWLNRLLGAALGGMKWVLFISVAICALEYFDSDNKMIEKKVKESSALYYPIREMAGLIMPAVQDFAEDILKPEHGTKERKIQEQEI